MTWKELKDKISLMTEEEQRQEVAVWGENMNLMKDCSLEKTDEDMYYNSEWDYTCEESELEPEDKNDPDVHKVYELKAKAEATDEQIKKQAEEMAKPEVVTLKVCFDTYGLLYRPNTCVDVEIPFYDDEKIRDMLNKASADIMKWCDKNMVKYNKELKESRSTKNIAKD